MASISFTCAHCAKVLRSSSRPAAGKKVRCPSCGETFLPELDQEDDEATRIQAKPSVNGKAKAKSNKADDDDEPAPPRKKRRRDEDDEEDDYDDRPIKKKKVKKKSGSMMMIVLLGAGGGVGLLSCILCGMGAFVWPGFLKGKNNAELAAFVPPDANIVIGGNPKRMPNQFADLERMLLLAPAFGPPGFGQPLNKRNHLADITRNCDNMLAFSPTKDLARNAAIVMIYQSAAADIAKFKSNPLLGPPQTIGGHADVHRSTEQGKQQGFPSLVAFPGNNLILTTNLSEQELVKVLNRGKDPPQPNAALELGKAVDRSPFWMAISFDAEMRRQMRTTFEQAGGVIMPLPGLKNAAPAADGVTGITVAFDFGDNQKDIHIAANMMCKTAADAAKMKTGIEETASAMRGFLQVAMAFQQPGQPKMPTTLMADLNSLTFTTKDTVASANMKLSAATLDELTKLGGQQQFGGPFPGPGPGPLPRPGPGPRPFPGMAPDVTPPPGAKNTFTFFQANIQPKGQGENICQFQKGKKITITMESEVNIPDTDVDLYVLKGQNGEFIVTFDPSAGPNGRVSFIVPEAGPYRIQVRNLGPGIATRSTVKVYEQ